MRSIAKIFPFLVLMSAFALAWPAAAQQVTLVPANPRYMEPVKVRITVGNGIFITGTKVRMTGSVIDVVASFGIDIGGQSSKDYLIGRFPTGDYTVRVRLNNLEAVTELRFTVPESPGLIDGIWAPPPDDYTGLYFDPAHPGWGMSAAQSPGGRFFIVWFVYDEQRRPTWYTIQAGVWDGCYVGPIVRTQGPPLGGPFDSATVVEQFVGNATVCFPARADSQGYVQYRFDNGMSGRYVIERQPLE